MAQKDQEHKKKEAKAKKTQGKTTKQYQEKITLFQGKIKETSTKMVQLLSKNSDLEKKVKTL